MRICRGGSLKFRNYFRGGVFEILIFFKGGDFEIHIDQENDKNVKWTVISRKMTENPKIFGASRLN